MGHNCNAAAAILKNISPRVFHNTVVRKAINLGLKHTVIYKEFPSYKTREINCNISHNKEKYF